MPLGTRGGLVATHNFPLEGDYTFKLILARNTVDVIRGLEEVNEVEILIDNARVFSMKIGGKEDTDKETVNPTALFIEMNNRLTAKIHVTAGPHAVAATFVKKKCGSRRLHFGAVPAVDT